MRHRVLVLILGFIVLPAVLLAGLVDHYTLSQDSTFRQRVEASIVKAAVSIAAEADTTAFHEKRLVLATKILNRPSDFSSVFALGVATDSAVATAAGVPPVQASVTDAQIDTAVSGQWNAFAGARE